MRQDMQRAHGFSLIEMIIVTVVLGIMAAVLAPLARNSLLAYDNTLDDLTVLDKLRYATERLAREIRGIQYANSTVNPAPACSGGLSLSPATCPDGSSDRYCISTMTANNLVFTRSYCDSSGALTTRNVTVGATSSAVTLAYSDMSGTGAQVLTDDLGSASNLAFAYYQKDGTTTATAAGNANCSTATTCVRYVQISLTLQNTVNGTTQNYVQRTRVDLRNQ